MGIDWNIVVFQAANFLLVMWILTRFLFRPVMRNMEERERAIESKIKGADAVLAKAKAHEKKLGREAAALEAARDEAMQAALLEAEAEKEEIMRRFHLEMVERRDAFQAQMTDERAAAEGGIRDAVGRALVESLRQAFATFAGGSLESAVLARFIAIAKSGKMDGAKALKARIAAGATPLIRSSWKLGEKDRAAVRRAMALRRAEFKTDKAMRAGIAVEAGDLTLSLSLDGYIDELQAKISGGTNV